MTLHIPYEYVNITDFISQFVKYHKEKYLITNCRLSAKPYRIRKRNSGRGNQTFRYDSKLKSLKSKYISQKTRFANINFFVCFFFLLDH